MAGDWIKVRDDLPDDIEVIRMANALGITQDEVVGKLIRFWVWVDRHMADCNARGVTSVTVDNLVCNAGFARVLEDVGWIKFNSDGFSIPNFERHMSENAKIRALTKKRVDKLRNARNVTLALPEKRRDDDDDDDDESSSSSTQESCNIIQQINWTEQIQTWNTLSKLFRSPKIREPLSEIRKRDLKNRLKDYPNLWDLVRIEAELINDFMKDKGYVTFDFIMKPSKLQKLLDGNYRRMDKRNEEIKPTEEQLESDYEQLYGSPIINNKKIETNSGKDAMFDSETSEWEDSKD